MSVYALPPGVDFAAELIAGLDARHPDALDLARVTLIVNTRRMERRLSDLYAQGPARLLPQIKVVTDLAPPPGTPPVPASAPPLRRRLEIIDLISKLLTADPSLAPRSSLYDLADSLITLMEEMQGEGVTADQIAALDISDQSGHWARAQQFFGIVAQYLDQSGSDGEGRQARIVDLLIAEWANNPPQHPIYVAGSTGSRGTTHRLMLALAQMPNCGVILPGFDGDQPDTVWKTLDNALAGEDHPQFRYRKLLASLDIAAKDVTPWTDTPPPSTQRNRLISLALRPAPVTDQWRREGPGLGDLNDALNGVTVIEATTARDEALAIALRLRQAAQTGETAALITPDRMLTRRVAAALDRWGIVPDDSAGTPLHLSPPGRLLRHVADMSRGTLTVETVLTLLKHPLTHSGAGRNQHQLLTRDLELYLRRKEIVYPTAETLRAFADSKDAAPWGAWLQAVLFDGITLADQPLETWVTTHHARAELLAAGSEDTSSGGLWDAAAGRKARAVMDVLTAESPAGGILSASDYASMLHALLSREEVRERDAPHPNILIWGTLEARAQRADVVILGGLNDGVWPQAPRPDPWLNRVLRHRAGLLLPDRQIGLSAHDFQIAAAAPEVWLTRSLKSDDAETVPSRWVNRITNLLTGLPDTHGPEAWKAAKERGAHWLDMAAHLDHSTRIDPAPRPAPVPPVDVRPRSLSVTDISRLRRDPYAVYARDILRLRPLNPVAREPDARLRGILLHSALEHFVKGGTLDADHLMALLQTELLAKAPWASTRALWAARMHRIAPHFVEAERARQAFATPKAFETKGTVTLTNPSVTLRGRADRIDLTANGDAVIYDYKTGKPPTKAQQISFDRQLLIEAAMVARGAFDDIGPRDVAGATYLGLGSGAPVEQAPLGSGEKEETIDTVWAKLTKFLAQAFAPDHGFTARRAMFETRFEGDYDHLARFGEWDHGTQPTKVVLT